MTYGLAKDPRRPWILGFIGVICITLLMFGGIFFGFHRLIPQPSGRVFQISVRPSLANKLVSPSFISTLPPLWQKALLGGSHWPVILGATYHAETGLQTYVVIPRWRRQTLQEIRAMGGGQVIQSYGLAVMVRSEASATDHMMRYTSDAQWWLRDGWARFVLDPQSLAITQASNQSSFESFHGIVGDQGIDTDLVFPEKNTMLPLSRADISFNISSSSSSLREFIMSHLALGDRPQAFDQTALTQVNVWMDDRATIEHIVLSFSELLHPQQAREILASFGVVSKHVQQVEDGTLSVEQTVLDTPDESLFHLYQTQRFGDVLLSPTSVQWGMTTSTVTTDTVNGCTDGRPWARLSARTMYRLWQTLAITVPIELMRPVQLMEREGKLSACFEE